MDKESKSGGGPSSSGIIAVVMLTAGVLFIREVPLETTRLPVNEPRIQQGVAQDVDARLWQDPFGAVAKAREEARKRDAEQAAQADAKRSPEALANEIGQQIARSGRLVEVLAVMLPGGPYSDNLETRRRVRYAVLAGLNASRLAPVDAEHLAYFFPEPKPSKEPAKEKPVGKGATATAAATRASRAAAAPEPRPGPPAQLVGRLPEIVPYEWFEPTPSGRGRLGAETQPLVLVMWVDGDAMASRPLASMYSLIGKLGALKPVLSWRVLGPGGSDGLRDMVEEVRRQGPEQPVSNGYDQLPIRFYSAIATAPDDRIFDAPLPPPGESLSAFLGRHHVQLVRTIGDDDRLAKALMAELGLRGLKSAPLPEKSLYSSICDWHDKADPRQPSHVAVISEWDTLYGRTLRGEFRAREKEEGYCVHSFAYVRGLDGQLPGSNADAGAPKSGGAKPADAKDEGRRRDGTYVEIAEGQSQFDYLRRLALRMAERDRELRDSSPDGKGLRAIGVLGSDVHDKLLVLQALQPEFPNAIFFTTDLDARFLHPREKSWTRNLIVGSNFGLRLSDRMQSTAPPFRDSYQAATFLSTRLAMDDARRAVMKQYPDIAGNLTPEAFEPTRQALIDSWFDEPRLFEIGRTQAFDFSPRAGAPAAGGGGPSSPRPPAEGSSASALFMLPASVHLTATAMPGAPASSVRTYCEGPMWSECGGVHPPPSALYPKLHFATLVLVLVLLIVPLWLAPLLASRALRRQLVHYLGGRGRQRLAYWRRLGLGVALLLLSVGLPLWLAGHWEPFAAWLTLNGKPISGSDGISIWPTEAIRLLTWVLCLYLIFIGWTTLSQNLDDIIARFRLGRTRQQLVAEQREAERKLPRWQKLVNMFSMRFAARSQGASATGLPVEAVDFWRRYIVQNRIGARAFRTVTYVVVGLGVSAFLWAAMHDAWVVPQRGELSARVHLGLHFLMFAAMYFLVFFVVDATAFCVSFVRGLREYGANWPVATLAKFENELRIPRGYLDNWIDLEFIAMRTKCVTRLIYFPFIVLSLFLVSRSAAFDDWYMPMTGIVLAVLGAGVALACAVALRYAAEASRRFAMERLRDEITQVSGEARAAASPAAAAGSSSAAGNQATAAPEPADPPGHVRPADPPKAAQLTLLLQRMDNLHEGAFAPFWQQPLLKAVLLPFATLGGTSLLDYLALVNV
ncbi:hypothetical protein [Variovorax sp. OV329]|uniref:hypothetical protein n=1 Tax=Variovorax sp. OV329 TaxID=1882825 RepID=UPI0008E0977C|nr:hypothetical protein [Variovorax sp. OV329]SFM16323.1 hypothetical protein SAMN05444747_103107 [Variovorax sp. OV329]